MINNVYQIGVLEFWLLSYLVLLIYLFILIYIFLLFQVVTKRNIYIYI